MIVFHRFQSRLIALILFIVILLQAAVFTAVSTATGRSARRASDAALQLTATAFKTTMDARRKILLEKAHLMSSDFAFKQVFIQTDHATLLSVLENHQKRAQADWMIAVGLDNKRIADTLAPEAHGDAFPYLHLIEQAANDPKLETSAIVFVKDKAYQIVIVPFMAPLQIAWIGIGFEITDQTAADLESQTQTQVSLLAKSAQGIRLLASTLNGRQRRDLLGSPWQLNSMRGATEVLQLDDEDFVTLPVLLHEDGDTFFVAALQRSLDQELAGFKRLRLQLILIFILTTVLAVVAAVSIARRVTRPVRALSKGAAAIASGDYVELELPAQQDELSELTHAFNEMVRGLLERDRVRALFGKVVSLAVADEMLNKRIEMGGEEREVTLLFSDIRDFTALCEHRAPSAILAMLNTYLTHMSAAVDEHDGVVDKYIGDAVMAIFGAPISHDNDAERAIKTALAMQAALIDLNRRFGQEGWPPLRIGIGIHSGNAVAGIMGSETRFDYTVLGDTVNLASRLEGLTKHYAIGIIVSATTRAACPDLVFREIDCVHVKGKVETIAIFQPLPQAPPWLPSWESAIMHYRNADWPAALDCFRQCELACPDDPVAKQYIERCKAFIESPQREDSGVAFLFESAPLS